MSQASQVFVYALLEELGISYQRITHKAVFQANDKDFDMPGTVAKNLFLKSKTGQRYYLVLLPIDKALDLNQLAHLLEEKRLSFASTSQLADFLQVSPGAVTPFGVFFDNGYNVQVVMDHALLHTGLLGFHPFVNTETLFLNADDFKRLMEIAKHPLRLEDL